jgi:hypothetical protein
MIRRVCFCLMLALVMASLRLGAQNAEPVGPPPPLVKTGGSANVKVLGHVPQGGFGRTADIEIEQELSRPYAYTSGMVGYFWQAISVKDPANPKVIYRWTMENPELHRGNGPLRGVYFKIKSRYYYVQGMQFTQGGPDADLGAIVFDVTGLPNPATVKEIARIRLPDAPGGFHNVISYKHSDGRALLIATAVASEGTIYDMEKVIAGGDPATWKIGNVPAPNDMKSYPGGWHDFYGGYDVANKQDKLYGAGAGGYYVYDITRPETPRLLYTMLGVSGVTWGHTITPTPDHKYVVTEAEYQFAPLRLFDLTPALEGKTQNVNRHVGAWTSDWQTMPHNHEVRWPYVFVSGYEEGLQIFNMINPKKPKTVGWYYTCECEHENGWAGSENAKLGIRGTGTANGAFGVDVRDADGLIVISDMETGFWTFRLDGFNGWKGSDWNMPNHSSAQDWDRGPVPPAKPVT